MKRTTEMNRTELVYELAKHAHPTWYHSLLEWPTYKLRALLAYYRGESCELPRGRIYRTKGLGDTPKPAQASMDDLLAAIKAIQGNPELLEFGIDWGFENGRVTARRHWRPQEVADEIVQNIARQIRLKGITLRSSSRPLLDELRSYRWKPAPERVVRRWLPVWAIWNDHTIDAKGAARLIVPSVWIRKGRTVRIVNFDGRGVFVIQVKGNITLEGTLDVSSSKRW